MSSTLVNRLKGTYEIGPNAEFGTRSFADSGFIQPIRLEAANRIEELENALEFYKLEAAAIAKNFDKNDVALLASIAVLRLDAGNKAESALET